MAIPLAPLAAVAAPAAINFVSDKLNSSTKNNDAQARQHYTNPGMEAEMGLAAGEKYNGFQEQADGKGKTALLTLGGAASGAMLAWKSADPEMDMKSRALEAAKGAFQGGGAAYLTIKANDAIQAEGGGLTAGVASAGAHALSSGLVDGGPGAMQSAMIGFGSGVGADFAHDKLTEAGHGGIADVLAGGAQGGSLGYTIKGDTAGLGLGALAGGGVGITEMLSNRSTAGPTMGSLPSIGTTQPQMAGQQQSAGMNLSGGNQAADTEQDYQYG